MKRRVLIIAGGTGGHIFPALAIARALREQAIDVQWLGTSYGLEQKLVSPEFTLHKINIKSLRGKGWLDYLFLPGRLMRAIAQTYRIMRRLRPHLVLGMGGYVAGPGGLSARLLRIPLVIQEQNAVAGWTNRFLHKIAHTTLEAFPDTFPKHSRVLTTGNPVRRELVQAPLPQERFLNREGPLRLLILGGSQGARAINQLLPATLADYADNDQITIWHQTGEADFNRVKQHYEKIAAQANVMPFIDDMAAAYCWADLVIARAGALTISEIAAVGLGSILIPYPHAADNHQWYNGMFLERVGAAMVINQHHLTKERLLALLAQFINNRPRLLVMAQAARAFATPKAVECGVNECVRILQA